MVSRSSHRQRRTRLVIYCFVLFCFFIPRWTFLVVGRCSSSSLFFDSDHSSYCGLFLRMCSWKRCSVQNEVYGRSNIVKGAGFSSDAIFLFDLRSKPLTINKGPEKRGEEADVKSNRVAIYHITRKQTSVWPGEVKKGVENQTRGPEGIDGAILVRLLEHDKYSWLETHNMW